MVFALALADDCDTIALGGWKPSIVIVGFFLDGIGRLGRFFGRSAGAPSLMMACASGITVAFICLTSSMVMPASRIFRNLPSSYSMLERYACGWRVARAW